MVGSNLLEKYIKQKKIIIGIDNLAFREKKFISHHLNKKNFFFLI